MPDMYSSGKPAPRFRGLPGLLVIFALLLTGLAIYQDYGVGCDEAGMRQIGKVSLTFVRTGNVAGIEYFGDKDHGTAFELPLKWSEEALGITAFDRIIHYRHLCTFIFYLAGIWSGYLLALRLFRRQWIALLGIVMLVLHPRIFAHAFFNSKDVPFLAALLIALNAISCAFAQKRIYLYALAGAACGFATGIRTMGLPLMLLTGCLLIRGLKMVPRESRGKAWRHLIAFCLSAAGTLYACWPALWYSPLRNLAYALIRTSRYSAWGGSVLFNGHEYAGTALPLYYIPEWFCISTPPVWLLLGGCGIILGAASLIKQRKAALGTARRQVLILCAACFALPVMAVILLRSVVYDDWRHLYFIYPPFVMLALFGVERLSRMRALKAAVVVICGVQLISTAAFMIRAHPYQQVYFNTLVPHRAEYLRRHFDYEYWCTAYTRGLAYIAQHDRRDTIIVIRTGSPMRESREMLPPADKQRIKLVEEAVPGAYLLTSYRLHPADFPYPKVWGMQIAGSTIMQIYCVDSAARILGEGID